MVLCSAGGSLRLCDSFLEELYFAPGSWKDSLRAPAAQSQLVKAPGSKRVAARGPAHQKASHT